MPSNTLVTDRGEWLRDTNAMLVSACCHFTMLIVVALVSVVGATGGDGSKLVVSLNKAADDGPSPIADPAPLEGNNKTANHSPLPADHQLEAALAPTNAMVSAALFSMEASAARAEIDVGPLALPTSPSAKSGSLGGLASLGELGPAGGRGGIGLGGGQKGEGSSGKAATDFFGIDGYGQSFVYVVEKPLGCPDPCSSSRGSPTVRASPFVFASHSAGFRRPGRP